MILLLLLLLSNNQTQTHIHIYTHTLKMFRNKELALLELDELEALFAKLTPEEIELLNWAIV